MSVSEQNTKEQIIMLLYRRESGWFSVHYSCTKGHPREQEFNEVVSRNECWPNPDDPASETGRIPCYKIVTKEEWESWKKQRFCSWFRKPKRSKP